MPCLICYRLALAVLKYFRQTRQILPYQNGTLYNRPLHDGY